MRSIVVAKKLKGRSSKWKTQFRIVRIVAVVVLSSFVLVLVLVAAVPLMFACLSLNPLLGSCRVAGVL